MLKRNWKRLQPHSLRHAMELCLEYAREVHHLSVDRVADRMGVNKWTLYKWIPDEKLPVHLVRAFEHACECPHCYVTRYLCHSARLLAIPMPTGRQASAREINALQASCTRAVDHLLRFVEGEAHVEDTLEALTQTMEDLAWHRGSVERSRQPDFEFEES